MKKTTKSLTLVSCVTLACLGSTSYAASLSLYDGDLRVRFDNTLRYNLGFRMESPDSKVYKSTNGIYDESNLKFDRGDIIQNRLDILTELDLIYKSRFGARVSAASWYDHAYNDLDVESYDANGLATSYNDDTYSRGVKRYYHGPSGEVLDAFVFGQLDLGMTPVNFRLGRHTVYWGEGLLFPGHSVAYSQAPIDGRKAAATPGIEAKETFLPLNQLSFQAQISDTLSLAGQYFMEWDSTRGPEGGTYFAAQDIALSGPDRFPLFPGYSIPRLDPETPDNRGNWGLALRWNARSLGATLGAYYRQFDDYNPAGVRMITAGGMPQAYQFGYLENTKLIGFSMAKEVWGNSVGADLSLRKDTALASTGLGADGKPATGDTVHLALNAIHMLRPTGLWSTGTVQAELAYAYLSKVDHNEALFNGENSTACENVGRDKWDGCATRHFLAGAVNFTPERLQVRPGLDLALPLTLNYGIYGNAAAGGGNQGAYSWSAGVRLNYQMRHELTLRYADQYARFNENDGVLTGNGNFSLNDRGYVSLTFKTSI